MKTLFTSYTNAIGWGKPLPDLDSKQTLILVFGVSACNENADCDLHNQTVTITAINE